MDITSCREMRADVEKMESFYVLLSCSPLGGKKKIRVLPSDTLQSLWFQMKSNP